ncbi:MFS transporter [Komagataeibacter xylinus]|uniref:MFS transporter n=5 Tax=Acetobacteraceae TaxID=433 RepID=A0A149UVB1_9PROT|nr:MULTISPECIES: MFS transporter [Acetobacteraceae]KXV22225.1 MFS transporter [Acetobacter malorum]KXV71142.1 MFS transporter [Acetobacter cerevisiae]KXV71878.1 MFS transporter [Acetobacter malorum]KXV76931.1 MFS transporter [Acetobacter cerevisiae]MCP1279925.1 MFS transporter [Acetobacter cerevisiae]
MLLNEENVMTPPRTATVVADETPAIPGLNRALFALCALNFFMADVQAGIGPFLGVFLQRHGWQTGPIGTVMTVGGVAGMLATIPAGALIDHTTKKRLLVIVAAFCTISASLLLLSSQSVAVVTVSQLATALAGAGIGPLMAAITLGIVRQKGFNIQIGRNQAWNHAGNMAGAGLSGWLGWQFGLSAIFFLEVAFGLFAISAVLLIPEKSIDHKAARGLDDKPADDEGTAEGLRSFLRHKPLLILASCLCFFHLGNAAMLPLYGMAVVSAGKGNPAMFTAMTVMVAQAVMIIVSLLAIRFVRDRGYWIVLLISFAALPLRGLIAGSFIQHWGVWPVQILDGIGAGLQSVAVPGLVARLLNGTGRINIGQGVVMTAQGIGASLSPALGGWLAEDLGYPVAFYTLGCFAIVSLGLWIGSASTLRSADQVSA